MVFRVKVIPLLLLFLLYIVNLSNAQYYPNGGKLLVSPQIIFNSSNSLKIGYCDCDNYTNEKGEEFLEAKGIKTFPVAYRSLNLVVKNIDTYKRTIGGGVEIMLRPLIKKWSPVVGFSFDYNTNFDSISSFDWEPIIGFGYGRTYFTYGYVFKRNVGSDNLRLHALSLKLIFFK